MKTIGTLVFFLFLLPLQSLNAQSELKVVIANLESNKGVVIVDLLDKDEKTVEAKNVKISDNKCTIIFKDLPNDRYGVRHIHDENENGELDTNLIGMPKEGFGFSNDPKGKMGPPDFEEWLFTVSGDTEIQITTRYL
jgi:uncharacterized protein (DUF2141 family)